MQHAIVSMGADRAGLPYKIKGMSRKAKTGRRGRAVVDGGRTRWYITSDALAEKNRRVRGGHAVVWT